MSLSKPTGGKGTLANDTSAFRRTLLWCGVAAAIHIVIIGGVSATQWVFKGSEADPAVKDANAAANAANVAPVNAANAAADAMKNTSRNTAGPSDDWLNPGGAPSGGSGTGNSAVERRTTEADSSKPDMTDGMNFGD